MIVRVETELFATPICPPQLRNVKLGDGAVERQLSLRCIEIRGDDNSVARPTSWCILFDGENISFDASFVIYVYINSTNIPPIMIITRIYGTQNLLSL